MLKHWKNICSSPIYSSNADVEALEEYIGEEHFISGLSIEVTLSELLAVVPRKRRRTGAYNALAKYLSEERNIVLTIKTNKKNDKKISETTV